MWKKIMSVSLVIVLLCCAMGVSGASKAEDPSAADRDALQAQFRQGVGPLTNGYRIDYRYYSPVKASDGVKYPLVIWLHGMGEGSHEGEQIVGNDIAFWASESYQARFAQTGGAFILAPRSIEEKMMYWDDALVEPLKAAIDDFIAAHRDNIDVTRIYIGGFSMGGKMTLKMAVAFPEMFAAAFPICPAWSLPELYALYLADLPIWLTSGERDPLVSFTRSVTPTWQNIIEFHHAPENCRFSVLSKTAKPDGSAAPSGHHSWIAVTNDMFSSQDGDYPYMSTTDGLGHEVSLAYPNGMIAYLSAFSSDYDGTPTTGTGNLVVEGSTHKTPTLDDLEKLITVVLTMVQQILSLISFYVD